MKTPAIGFLAFCAIVVPVVVVACGGSSTTTPDASMTIEGGSPPGCPTEPDVVSTDKGCLRGSTVDGIHTFLGVPFAAPPLGDLRWKPPAPATAWTGVRDALAYSKACPQIAALVNGTTLDWSEDCLYLNVWSSAALDRNAKLPVMVWIHGGGLVNGSGIEPIYSGKVLAKSGGVVSVNVNYRLGQMGYLAHPALSAEQGGKSGDEGLRDQIAALAWVKANIAAFGGDPDNVTVFGESAGALSTCALLASPLAKGMFHRAIAESGSCVPIGNYARPLKTQGMIEGAEEQGVRYATALGCTSGDILPCMRAKPADMILKTMPAVVGVLGQGERYGFAIDGDALPDSPDALTKAGNYNKVPVIEGTNADEGTIFTIPLMITTDMQYQFAVNAGFGANGPAVLAQYPSNAYPSPKAALDAVVTDAVFACPARRKVRDFAKHSDVWLYQFTYVPSYATALGIGSFHGSEIDFVLGTLDARKVGMPTMEERTLSTTMMGYWTSFAKTGIPNGAVAWPKYDANGDTNLTITAAIATTTGLKKAKCDFWDGL